MLGAVSNTNFVNNKTLSSKQDDIKTLLKYSNNEVLKEVPDTFTSTIKGGVGSAAVFEGIPLLKFLFRGKNVKNIRTSNGVKVSINDAMKALDERNSKALKNVFKGQDGTVIERISKFIRTQNQTKKDFINLKDATKSANNASKLYTKQNPKKVNKMMSAIDDAIEKADYFMNPMKTEVRNTQQVLDDAVDALSKLNQGKSNVPTNKLSELAKKSQTKKLNKTIEKTSKKIDKLNLALSGGAKAGKLGKVKSFMKSSGAGIMLVFSGITETLTEVVPTFKELGFKKGVKQVGKSVVKVVADTAGFIAGEQLGMAVGSAIGTAIMPGIGTAVGSVVGFIGGMVGSFVAGKVSRAIVGQSEREKAKEQQQNELAKQLENDQASLEELKKVVSEKIAQEQATTGQLSEDSQIALQTLKNIEKTNPFTV